MLTFLKQSIVPTLIILAAAALVIIAVLPLAQTDWADGFRTGFGGEGTEQVAEAEGFEGEDGRPSGIIIYVMSSVKVFILMGIGALLTFVVLGIVRIIGKGVRRLKTA